MSEESKVKSKNLSRREFLKNAGIVVGTTTVGSAFLLTSCGDEKEITKTVTTTTTDGLTVTRYICPVCNQEFDSLSNLKNHYTIAHPGEGQIISMPKASKYIEVHPERCVGCEVCLLACSSYNFGIASRSLAMVRLDIDPLSPDFYEPRVCMQCDYPSCYFACPLKDIALCIDPETGLRYINADKCNGCGECVEACPYEPSRINCDMSAPIAERKAFKCNLCNGREGGPACVEFCQTAALTLAGEGISADDVYGEDAPGIGDLV